MKEIDTTAKYDDKQHSSSEFYESLISCIIHEINKYNKEINLSNNNAGHNLLEIPEFFQMEIKNIKTCNEDIHQLYEKINFETHRMIRLKFIDYIKQKNQSYTLDVNESLKKYFEPKLIELTHQYSYNSTTYFCDGLMYEQDTLNKFPEHIIIDINRDMPQ